MLRRGCELSPEIVPCAKNGPISHESVFGKSRIRSLPYCIYYRTTFTGYIGTYLACDLLSVLVGVRLGAVHQRGRRYEEGGGSGCILHLASDKAVSIKRSFSPISHIKASSFCR
jgi:hypothetical protein